MKKKFLFLFILGAVFLFSNECAAQMSIDHYYLQFQVHAINPTGTQGQMPRNPIDPPTVYLEDYTLTFEVDHPEYVLYIKDEDEVVVYSTVVTSATTEVVLPSTLSGDYVIELITGDWLFTGWIEL